MIIYNLIRTLITTMISVITLTFFGLKITYKRDTLLEAFNNIT